MSHSPVQAANISSASPRMPFVGPHCMEIRHLGRSGMRRFRMWGFRIITGFETPHPCQLLRVDQLSFANPTSSNTTSPNSRAPLLGRVAVLQQVAVRLPLRQAVLARPAGGLVASADVEGHGQEVRVAWILCRGGCSGSGVQWIGVVLYSKLIFNVI